MRSDDASAASPRDSRPARCTHALSAVLSAVLIGAGSSGTAAAVEPTRAERPVADLTLAERPALGRASERPLAESLDIDALMTRLAAVRGVRAHFREEKRLALLTEPLVSEGWLYVVPPDRMLRITDRPARSRLAIEGDRLVMEDDLGREEIDLASQPAARHFVDHMLLVFRGDLELLRKRYEVEYRATGDAWRLTLAPRDRLMRRIVERIELAGEGPVLHSMILSEPEGDATHTRFDSVEIDHAFAPAEVAALFRGAADPELIGPDDGLEGGPRTPAPLGAPAPDGTQ